MFQNKVIMLNLRHKKVLDINSTNIYLNEHEKNKKFVEFKKEREEKYFIHKKVKDTYRKLI